MEKNLNVQGGLNNYTGTSFKKIINITYPIILSMFSMNIMIFIDRAFVAKYDITEFAATMPASNLAVTISSVFTGIIGYSTVLIAQYYGAKRYKECTSAMWQSIYLSIIFLVFSLIIAPIAVNIFKVMGHSGDLLKYEMQFFYLITISNCIQFFITTFAGFCRGIGNTRSTMIVGVLTNIINIIMDWVLIFGNFGFPKLGGINGSGLATIISCLSGVVLYIVILNSKKYNDKYGLSLNKKINKDLCYKLFNFGLPAGIQTFISTGYYSILLLIIGNIGTFNLSCANIAFTIEGISVFPISGLGVALSIVVGQERGAGRTDSIIEIVKKGALLGIGFGILIIFTYNIFPKSLISIFNSGEEQANFLAIENYTVLLVRLTSIWILFDTIQIIISSVLRAVGDTKFMMKIFMTVPLLFYIILPYVLCVMFKLSLIWIWIELIIYTLIMFSLVLVRLFGGKWKSIKVI